MKKLSRKQQKRVFLFVIIQRYTTKSELHKKRIAVKLVMYTDPKQKCHYGIEWVFNRERLFGLEYTTLEKAEQSFLLQHKRDTRQDPTTSIIKSGSDWGVR